MWYILVLLIGAALWIATRNSLFLISGLVGFLLLDGVVSPKRKYGGNGSNFRDHGEAIPDKSWVDSLSLVDPRFNLREVAKQMILLEDHLFHVNKHCLDCISKHSLSIEGFLEEAITLDSTGEYRAEILEVLSPFKQILFPFIEKMKKNAAAEADFEDVANRVRQLRKPIAKKYSYYDI